MKYEQYYMYACGIESTKAFDVKKKQLFFTR